MNRIDYYPTKHTLFIPIVAMIFSSIGIAILANFGLEAAHLAALPLAGGACMFYGYWKFTPKANSPVITLFDNHMEINIHNDAIKFSYEDIRGIYWGDDIHYPKLSITIETADRIITHEVPPAFLSADPSLVYHSIKRRIPMKPKHESERGSLYAASFDK